MPLVLAVTAALAGEAGWGDLAEVQAPTHEAKIYGFIDSYFEVVAPDPSVPEGERGLEAGFDLPNVNVMVQGTVHGKFRYFLNLAGPGAGSVLEDSPISIRNAWVEAPLKGQYLAVRAGKLYRRFGLYNEILDAVPTFIGIEPPELFDKDHLMVTRTTNLMFFGEVGLGGQTRLLYSASTGNDERGPKAIPFGADLQVRSGGLKVGSSLYTSGGAAHRDHDVGEGPPHGAVLPWMAEDRFTVVGGYAEVVQGGLTAQAAYWRAMHDATRDPEQMALMDGLSKYQLDRFFVDGDPASGLTSEEVRYNVQTAYFRLGYQVPMGHRSSVTPYVQGDWYSNPEIVASKSLGGDNEAGLSDDGQFLKYTVGAVVRPYPEVALKVDGSAHQLTYDGQVAFYPELRVSFSYLWQLDLK